MKKILNKFAYWLYKKTLPNKERKSFSYCGMKVIKNDFIASDTIYIGNFAEIKIIELIKSANEKA